MKKITTSLAVLATAFICLNVSAQDTITPVASFGSNPGNLNMYSYVPDDVPANPKLVVVMHGCRQSANLISTQTGWNKLADRHKFVVVYPEQKLENNAINCFNWFDSLYQEKGQLQVLSIKQMVDYMESNYSIDTSNIYVTGLSAGGAMTSIMLATYPETFKKGAIMAGVPYKASKDTLGAYYAMYGFITKTAEEWGGLVKSANPSYEGEYPDVAIFHGGLDSLVYLVNATELTKQWTNVNGADQVADVEEEAFKGDSAVSLSIYKDSLNNPSVYYYKIREMAHGIAVDTGFCPKQGGETGTNSFLFDFHSTYWAADFFGLITEPYEITGDIRVRRNQRNVRYRVENTPGSMYTWSVPSGATIVNGQGSNTIRVNFSRTAGDITVEEVTAEGCVNDTATLAVSLQVFGIVGDIFDFIVDPFVALGRQVPLFNRGHGKNGVNEEKIIPIREAISANETTIFPNPFSESASIQFAIEQINMIISIYDVFGSKVSETRFSGTQYHIERGNLLPGIYFIQIVKENGETSNHKIIIQ